MRRKLDALDNPKLVAEALLLVDTRFRDILSLQEIIVEVYKDGLSDHIRREMQSHGWTISAKEYVEEEDFDTINRYLINYYEAYGYNITTTSSDDSGDDSGNDDDDDDIDV
jgi:hypothetical protein